jgi:23S rRNA pseudouridine2605 synthase/16S rRNA pseudouridine516 synthase
MARQREPKWLKAAKAGGFVHPGAPKADFVSRALSRAGVMPSNQAEAAVIAGRVKVNGRVMHEPFAPLPVGAKVQVDGTVYDVTPTTKVLAFHKSKNMVVNGTDDEGGTTVFNALIDVLPLALRGFGWLAVGRLDRDTTGLLLFTNDEQFVSHATSPETHLPKVYLVTVAGQVTEEKLATLRRGVTYDGFTSKPAKAVLRAPGVLALTLTEGKFHQVKRMVNEVNLATLELHREAVGEHVLDVPLNAFRELTEDEILNQLGYTPRQRR